MRAMYTHAVKEMLQVVVETMFLNKTTEISVIGYHGKLLPLWLSLHYCAFLCTLRYEHI